MNLLKQFTVTDPFWTKYETLLRRVVIPYQEKALRDQIPGAEKSHAIENFEQAARVLETGRHDEDYYGRVFQDSDLAKWIEAASYSLAQSPDPELETRLDALIALIGRAQHKDGYLNTYFTVKEPGKRWTNLQWAHELYCAGHMIEAAVAYYESTGKRSLLSIMQRMADHIYDHFIVKGAEGYPGHPEIELALMRLYRATGEKRYLDLSRHFIDVRGADPAYFEKEAMAQGRPPQREDLGGREYAQNHAPVREQKDAVGHAVRAMYLYTAMADQAAETGDRSLREACETLWRSVADRRMYITGGIGSTCIGEAFTKDYDLPNDTAYAETCASIGLVFFARKMLEIEADSRYSDVMERALYNTVLSGMQLDGTRFFYVNPLEVVPGIAAEAPTHSHVLPERQKWFGCACCPPNVSRMLTSIAKYAWGVKGSTVYSHLFVGGTLDLTGELGVRIAVTTDYPYAGHVTYQVLPSQGNREITLAIRVPSWSETARLTIDGKETDLTTEKGYVYITRTFTGRETVELTLDMEPKRIYARTAAAADSGRVAFQRGPFVYCVEGVDNEGDVLPLFAAKDGRITALPYDENLLGGTVALAIEGFRRRDSGSLYSMKRPEDEPCTLIAVPYYTWANRAPGSMRVWIPEQTR